MKIKLFATTIIVGMTIVIGTPYATGMMAEDQYQTMIRANPFTPSLQLESRNFKRGVFSSEATTFVEIRDPSLREMLADKLGKDESGKTGLLIHHHLNHGPFIFTAEQGIAFAVAEATHQVGYSDSINDVAKQQSDSMDIFQLDTRLHFDGSQDIELSSREITTKSSKASTTVMPLLITLVTDKSYRSLKGSGDWDGFTSENSQSEKVSLSDGQFELDMEKSGELWLGSVELNQHSMVFSSLKARLQMEAMKLNARSSEKGDARLVDSASEISLQQIKTSDKTFGPGELSLAISNLPAATLERLSAIQQQALNSSTSDQQFALQAAGFKSLNLLPELVSHGIVIDMKKLYLNTPDGEITGHLNISLPKSNPSSLMNIPHLKSIIKLHAELSIPVALIPEATMNAKIQPMLKRGYLKMDGMLLKSEIRMSGGVLTMNNQPVPLPY